MEFDIAGPPPTNYGIFHNFFFLNEGFPYSYYFFKSITFQKCILMKKTTPTISFLMQKQIMN